MEQKSKLTLKQKEEVRQMYLEGKKIREIAEHFNTGMSSITYVCKDICNRNGAVHKPKQIDPVFQGLLIEWEKLRLQINPHAEPYRFIDTLEKEGT